MKLSQNFIIILHIAIFLDKTIISLAKLKKKSLNKKTTLFFIAILLVMIYFVKNIEANTLNEILFYIKKSPKYFLEACIKTGLMPFVIILLFLFKKTDFFKKETFKVVLSLFCFSLLSLNIEQTKLHSKIEDKIKDSGLKIEVKFQNEKNIFEDKNLYRYKMLGYFEEMIEEAEGEINKESKEIQKLIAINKEKIIKEKEKIQKEEDHKATKLISNSNSKTKVFLFTFVTVLLMGTFFSMTSQNPKKYKEAVVFVLISLSVLYINIYQSESISKYLFEPNLNNELISAGVYNPSSYLLFIGSYLSYKLLKVSLNKKYLIPILISFSFIWFYNPKIETLYFLNFCLFVFLKKKSDHLERIQYSIFLIILIDLLHSPNDSFLAVLLLFVYIVLFTLDYYGISYYKNLFNTKNNNLPLYISISTSFFINFDSTLKKWYTEYNNLEIILYFLAIILYIQIINKIDHHRPNN